LKNTFLLHPAQQDVFIDQLINENSPQYNIGGYIIIKGKLNKSILHQAINSAPLVFDAFKMRFDANAPGLIGYIDEDYEVFKLIEKDLSNELNASEAVMKWMQHKMNEHFAMVKSNCLFEQILFKLSDDEHWLFGRFHHLIMDGFGFVIWMQYMSDKYNSLLSLSPVAFSFPSYLEAAAVANSDNNSANVTANNDYWKEKLKNRPANLFQKKYVVPPGETPASAYTCELEPTEQEQLKHFSRTSKAAIHQLTIAALLIYFGKISANETFVFGLPVHKRNSRKLRQIIGLFNGFIPFQNYYQPEQSVEDLIRSVVVTQSADYRHQDLSISSLGRHLQLNPAEENLFELIVNYLPFNLKLNFGAETEASIFRLVNEYERIPLQVCWNDYGENQPLELQIHFSKEYFNDVEIKLFTRRLRYILSQLGSDPSKKVSDISILPPEEAAAIESFGKNKVPEAIYSLPIPFQNYRTLILDRSGQPTPIGVPGYLCFIAELNGEQLATPVPEKLNTGLLVSWLPNGEILKLKENTAITNNSEKIASKPLPINISATFVAEMLEEYVNFWSSEFDLNLQVNFAPYNQVFQQLLNFESLFNTGEGINVLLLRPEDWLRDQLHLTTVEQVAFLQKVSEQFITALTEARQLSAKPYLLGIVPWILNKHLDAAVIETINGIYQKIRNTAANLSLVYELDLPAAVELYDVQDIFDPKADEAGHIPFTDDFYAALGTYITRRIRAWKVPAYKVIALDCDNTLWKGICGEVGALNVLIDTDYQYLQNFLINKWNEGFLLVLCSKNNEEDVWEVFDSHPQMKLKREHVTAYQINWQPKPANLQAIAKELNLGTDSFIFLDDNAFETEQMEMAYPGVLSLTLPEEPENISSFLDHTWAFDTFQVTEEDRQRNQMYKAEKQRKEEQVKHSNIDDFLLTLGVRVLIRKLEIKDVERAVQLSLRTNQFNLNGIRKNHSEILQLIATDKGFNRIIEVQDKFGDYGIVGLILAGITHNELNLNTFLLSCRVLGRNVEETVLKELVKFGAENGLQNINALFQSTGKNKPFIEFLERTNWIADSHTYNFPIQYSMEELSSTP
jgi:FkbH-like protein